MKNTYDRNDPWDRMLLLEARSVLTGGAFDLSASGINPKKDKDCWDFVTMFVTDGQYSGSTGHPEDEDSFGPWGGKMPLGCKETKLTNRPQQLVSPEEVKPFLNGKETFEIQFYTKYVARSKKDHFVVRVWNLKEKREEKIGRFYAPKLSWAVTAAWFSLLKHKPRSD